MKRWTCAAVPHTRTWMKHQDFAPIDQSCIGLICWERKHIYVSRGPSLNCVFLKFQWSPSWMLCKKSLVESSRQAVGTGQGAMLHTSASPGPNCFLSFPSNDAQALPLLLKGTCTLSVTCSGNIRGLKDKECGQIGVNNIPGTWKLVQSQGNSF